MEYPKEVAELIARLEGSAEHRSGTISLQTTVVFEKHIACRYSKSPIRGVTDICGYTNGRLTDRTVCVDMDYSEEWESHPHRKVLPRRVQKMIEKAELAKPHRQGAMRVFATVSFEQVYDVPGLGHVKDICTYDEFSTLVGREIKFQGLGDCCDDDQDNDGLCADGIEAAPTAGEASSS